MAVANGSRLIARLQNAISVAENSPIALPDVAIDTINDVKANAIETIPIEESTQVGFDLGQFLANITDPGPLVVSAPGVGSIGILDNERMGTVADYEKIAGERLFHQGTRDRAGVWRNVVYPNPAWRDMVDRERRAIWGQKTPQWYFFEHGYSGDGAYPATSPHHFIADASRETRIIPRMRAAFARLFEGL